MWTLRNLGQTVSRCEKKMGSKAGIPSEGLPAAGSVVPRRRHIKRERVCFLREEEEDVQINRRRGQESPRTASSAGAPPPPRLTLLLLLQIPSVSAGSFEVFPSSAASCLGRLGRRTYAARSGKKVHSTFSFSPFFLSVRFSACSSFSNTFKNPPRTPPVAL